MMPAAAGAVAAGAVADQMLGPKEDRHLAIVLVFLFSDEALITFGESFSTLMLMLCSHIGFAMFLK